jgi:excinuclease UvrABC ATPase subunit
MIMRPSCAAAKASLRKRWRSSSSKASPAPASTENWSASRTISPLDKRKNHTIEVVIDRLLVKPGIAHRLEQSVALAMKLAGGLVLVAVVGGDEQLYSEKLACPDCGIDVPQLEPRSFSFNSAYGACPECHGLGSKYDFDPAKVITDWSKPLLEGGLGPGSASQNLIHQLKIVLRRIASTSAHPSRNFPKPTRVCFSPASPAAARPDSAAFSAT